MVPFYAKFNSAYNPTKWRANPSLKTNREAKNSNMVLTLPTCFLCVTKSRRFRFSLNWVVSYKTLEILVVSQLHVGLESFLEVFSYIHCH
jgi:hypothetical protein